MQATARKIPEKVWIPQLSPFELNRRVTQIRPVVCAAEMLYYIAPVDPVKQSFLWNPKMDGMAFMLRPVENILTYHRYSKYADFTPSIAEVLAAIEANLTGYVVAFEIIRQLNAPVDLHEHREAVDAGYHVAHTRLYRDA